MDQLFGETKHLNLNNLYRDNDGFPQALVRGKLGSEA